MHHYSAETLNMFLTNLGEISERSKLHNVLLPRCYIDDTLFRILFHFFLLSFCVNLVPVFKKKSLLPSTEILQ